jgi:SAM-dependent methyltransferase
VLDVGTGDGALFRLAGRGIGGIGLDPTLTAPAELSNARLLPGRLPHPDVPPASFDAITLLAVLEHVPPGEQTAFARECARHLRPGGLVVVTVPSPRVDAILGVLLRLRLVDGLSLEEHFGFDPRDVPRVFAPPAWELVRHAPFQLGLNHLFVFRLAAPA